MRISRRYARTSLIVITFAIALLAPAAPVHATARSVTNLNDDGSAGCLRTLIAGSASGDTIVFSVSGTITLAMGELTIGRSLTIAGPAPGITINGNTAVRVFNIAAGTVNISRVAIANGRVTGTPGIDGVMTENGGDGGVAQGGGIFNHATLILTECSLISNGTVGGTGGAAGGSGQTGGSGGNAQGGAIFNAGTLVMSGCTLSGSRAQGGAGDTTAPLGSASSGGHGGEASGAAVDNEGNLTASNCTFNGGVAQGGAGGVGADGVTAGRGGDAHGGAISGSGTLALTNCTLIGGNATAGNGANGGGTGAGGNGGNADGGILKVLNTAPTLRNTIIAGGSVVAGSAGTGASGTMNGTPGTAAAPDVSGAVNSQGHNLVGRQDGNSGWTGSDLLGGIAAATKLDPLLGILQDNGGPTLTRRPMSSSAAIDAGDDAVLNPPFNLSSDQRGYTRKLGGHVDIGAVETGPLQTGPNFTVTTLAEHDYGSCMTDECTLLEAINGANANSDASTIDFVPGLSGTILNSFTSSGLALTHSVSINGLGTRLLTVSGNDTARVFRVVSGATVTISDLTIAHGNQVNIDSGGGISNSGTLTLQRCAVVDNAGGSGGGAVNAGTLNINNCTFAGNQSSGNGAAVRNTGVLHITNSTFYLNVGVDSGAIASFVSSGPAASATITNCTIALNNATDPSNSTGGGVLNGNLSTTTVANSIIADNNVQSGVTGVDVSGNFNSLGSNFLGNKNGSTGFGASDHEGDPGLDTSAKNNGGPTDTFALLSGEAINGGNDANAPLRDQRGLARAGASDIGAFEVNGIPLRVLGIIGGGNNIVVTFGAIKGETYRLERKLAPSDPAWQEIAGVNDLPANMSGSAQFTDPNAISLGKAFYQVRLLP